MHCDEAISALCCWSGGSLTDSQITKYPLPFFLFALLCFASSIPSSHVQRKTFSIPYHACSVPLVLAYSCSCSCFPPVLPIATSPICYAPPCSFVRLSVCDHQSYRCYFFNCLPHTTPTPTPSFFICYSIASYHSTMCIYTTTIRIFPIIFWLFATLAALASILT